MARHPPTAVPLSPEVISRAPRRIEGREKVTGRLRYVGDIDGPSLGVNRDELLHAVAITATQASGRIIDFDDAAALAAPGVTLLMTHRNAPRLKKVMSMVGAEIAELLPLQEAVVRYGGQCVAVLVADTLQHAIEAANLVKVSYSDPERETAFTLSQGADRATDAKTVGSGTPGQVKVGKAEEAFASSAHQIDVTVETAPHHHNAMEPGGGGGGLGRRRRADCARAYAVQLQRRGHTGRGVQLPPEGAPAPHDRAGARQV